MNDPRPERPAGLVVPPDGRDHPARQAQPLGDRRRNLPDRRPATRTVVYDDFGNPLAVFIQVSPANVFMSFKGQPDFEPALLHLREALFEIGSILGETTGEDILRAVFSKFCIGK